MEWWVVIVVVVVLLFGFVAFRGAPYVPSHRRFARQALSELYPLSSKDLLVDLGSGDGVILRLAAEKGARAVGYELNPALVLTSKLLARGNPNIQTKLADMWLTELPKQTTVVYVFAVTRDIAKVEQKLQQTVDMQGRSIWAITYGSKLPNKKPTKELKAHALYLFEPQR